MSLLTTAATQLLRLAGIGLAALIAGKLMDHLIRLVP